MKVTNCYIERTYNLGNYESLKVGFEAVLNENDKPLEVSADLENLTFQHFQNKAGRGSAVSNVPTTFSPSAQSPPTSTAKDGTACPKCGGKKKPNFELCYRCHEEEKAT